MSYNNVNILKYGSLQRINSQEYGGSYDIFLATQESQLNTNLKQKKFNQKRIRLVATVLFVTAIFLGVYAAYGGSIVLNEVGTAASYFEPSPVAHSVLGAGQSAFAYYYFAWWSPSHDNAIQSMINALYACGLGYVFNLFGNFLGQEFGIYLTTEQVVIFVAQTLYGMYEGATAVNAALAAAEGLNWDLGMTAIDIIVQGFVEPVLYPLIAVVASM